MPAIARLFLHFLLLWLLSIAAMKGGTSAVTHSNFLQAAVLGGRRNQLWCGADPAVCSNREKNPWGGDTCCFQAYCKDTARDVNHCGKCGHRCAYGLLCCGGMCTDIRDNPDHCGSCYNRCRAEVRCTYGMCDYAGG